MCHTLKQAVKDDKFIKALNWLKKEQHYRLSHDYYTKKDEIYGQD